MTDRLTTTAAAARLGIKTRRVLALISEGRLPATKEGRDWLIRPEDLALPGVAVRKPGWRKGRKRKE